MKFRGLLAAVVVLAALGGVLWWSQHHQPKPAESTPALPAILRFDAKSVTGLTLHDKGAAPIVLTPGSGAAWQITAPISFRADSEAVNQMVAGLANLVPQRVVEDHAANLSSYGLSDPALSVDVTRTNHQSAHLLLGDKTPTGDGIYAMIPGNPHVYTVGAWVDNTLGKSVDDLRDRHLVPVHTPDINKVEILRGGQDIAIARVPGGWQIQKPAVYRTSNYEVDNLIEQVVSATWDPSANAAQSDAAFSHGSPVATAQVTTGMGANTLTDSLEIRKSKDDYYAKSSSIPGIWKVDAALATALDRDVDAYRNKQLFDFGYAEPVGIQVHSGTTSLSLARSGSAWFSSGKKMDSDSVEALVTAIRGLAAAKFATSGYAKPDIDLTVNAGGAHPPEAIHIQKTSDGGIAKRDDGQGLYVLDADTMSNFTKAVDGVKPAAAPVSPPKKK